jgi:hypothetical protein
MDDESMSEEIYNSMEQMDVMLSMLEGLLSRLRTAGFTQKSAEQIILHILYNQ